ncbi:MAG: rhamnogalacturonan acetylesterase [Breznakibacter sp.]
MIQPRGFTHKLPAKQNSSMRPYRIFMLLVLCTILFGVAAQKKKPTIFTIGDSTVKNGQGDGAGGLWGWGDPFQLYFDTTQVALENHARGGTSSRTYRSMGLWQNVLEKIKKGDYVLMQFGHNDNGPLNDSTRARGTIKGIGDETETIQNILTRKQETVHTYGWYMTQFIREAKAKGATPIVILSIPRNDWKDGKVPRNDQSYGLWAKQVAQKEKVMYIDLNAKMAGAMENLGEASVTEVLFFQRDHTHPTAKGAVLAASLVVEGIRETPKCKLNKYLLEDPKIVFPVKKKVLIIGDSTVANGRDSVVGWGTYLAQFMDTTRVEIINKARGGRSSRTFLNEKLWEEALPLIGKNDVVVIQFGHNDGGAIDKPKFRASIPGNGNENQEVTIENGSKEIVHSYGWYLRKYIGDTKKRGAQAIVLSHIPRNQWVDGKVERCADSYGAWAMEAAQQGGALFIDFNELIAREYEKTGPEEVARFFPRDHTHTNSDGAMLNAAILAEALYGNKDCPLKGYVEKEKITSPSRKSLP